MAWTMAEEGKRTAVVKRKYIGHPVRTLPASRARTSFISAKVASFVGRHREVGIETGPVSVDMEGFYQRKRKMVDDLAGQPYTTLRDAVFPPSDDVGGGQLTVLKCAECLTVQSAEGLEMDAREGR